MVQCGEAHGDAEGSVSGAEDAVSIVVAFEALSLPL